MLINVSEGEECRIALLEDGRLQELYMERTSSTSHVGNIYKGRVTNVEPSIQAAFVDFGLGRNGFPAHLRSDAELLRPRDGEDIQESVGRKISRRDRPPIQRCLRRGDEIVVQIIKEGIGTKGPTLSTYLSIPGKHPGDDARHGQDGRQQKDRGRQERRRLRMILDGLKPPKTSASSSAPPASARPSSEIERDLKYLTRCGKISSSARCEDPGSRRTVHRRRSRHPHRARRLFSSRCRTHRRRTKRSANGQGRHQDPAPARAIAAVELYESPVPLFHQANIEREIEMMYSRHVPLPSGGSLVIDSTEAVVAIDVNSGKNRDTQ